jgi:hypothetical protein
MTLTHSPISVRVCTTRCVEGQATATDAPTPVHSFLPDDEFASSRVARPLSSASVWHEGVRADSTASYRSPAGGLLGVEQRDHTGLTAVATVELHRERIHHKLAIGDLLEVDDVLNDRDAVF